MPSASAVEPATGRYENRTYPSAMGLRDDDIYLEKPLNALDELVFGVVSILERHDVRYVVVSGYVTVLLGRSRATEAIDVIVDPFDEATASDLATDLHDASVGSTPRGCRTHRSRAPGPSSAPAG